MSDMIWADIPFLTIACIIIVAIVITICGIVACSIDETFTERIKRHGKRK